MIEKTTLCLKRKNKATVILEAVRFDDIKFFPALLTLRMTAEFMLSKGPVLRIILTLFFLRKLFSSYICNIPSANFEMVLQKKIWRDRKEYRYK